MKYKLTNNTITASDGLVLHQIQALRDFGDVRKDELGGWIEKEGNLSQYGRCWVYDEAQVYGDAIVCDSAWVYGNARVYDCARVCGDAQITDNAVVCGSAWVHGDTYVYGDAIISGDANILINTWVRSGEWSETPLQIDGSEYFVNSCMITPEILRIGCEEHTIPVWLKDYRIIAAKHDIRNENTIEEYLGHIRKFAEKYCPEAINGE